MNRRGFIGAVIAALGSLVVPSAAIAKFVEPSLLEKTKWLLLPGLWATFQDTGIESDIRVENGFLVVFAGDWETGKGFTITEKAIRDGTYLTGYEATLSLLKELVIEGHERKKWNADWYLSKTHEQAYRRL